MSHLALSSQVGGLPSPRRPVCGGDQAHQPGWTEHADGHGACSLVTSLLSSSLVSSSDRNEGNNSYLIEL